MGRIRTTGGCLAAIAVLALCLAAGEEANCSCAAPAPGPGEAEGTLAITSGFLIFGAVIIIGFFSNLAFERTMIPDPLLLIAVGFLLGPATHIVDPTAFHGIAPVFSILALVIIVFDGGINIRFAELLEGIPRATLLAVSTLALSIAACVCAFYAFGMDPLLGLLFGFTAGGTSSAIVIPLMRNIRADERTVTLVNLESALNDGMTVVGAIAIMQFMLMTADPAAGASAANPLLEAAHSIASGFSIGAMVGLIFGILWLVISRHFAGHVFAYLLVAALVFVVYAITELLRGNGAIGVLIYGLVLGNGVEFAQFFRLRNSLFIDETVKMFHREISFFVKTVFFVYLGLLIGVPDLGAPDLAAELRPFILGAVISVLLVVGRYLAVIISTRRSEFEASRGLLVTMLPRGLDTAVLALLPRSYGLVGIAAYAGIEQFSNIAFTIILLTVLFCTVGVWRLSRRRVAKVEGYAHQRALTYGRASEAPARTAAHEAGEGPRTRPHGRPAGRERTAGG